MKLQTGAVGVSLSGYSQNRSKAFGEAPSNHILCLPLYPRVLLWSIKLTSALFFVASST